MNGEAEIWSGSNSKSSGANFDLLEGYEAGPGLVKVDVDAQRNKLWE